MQYYIITKVFSIFFDRYLKRTNGCKYNTCPSTLAVGHKPCVCVKGTYRNDNFVKYV